MNSSLIFLLSAAPMLLFLLLAVWLHGCIGFHMFLRFRPWYGRVAPALAFAAILIPFLAILGISNAGWDAALRVAVSPDFAQSHGPPAPGTAGASELTTSDSVDETGGLNTMNTVLDNEAAVVAAANRFDRDVTALTTLTAVATAYFQVLASQDRLRTAESNTASASRVLDAIKQRFKSGNLVRFQPHDGLVIDAELVLLDRFAQIFFQL